MFINAAVQLFLINRLRKIFFTEALLAFAQSVKTYNPENGSFISYAKTVIRNRLIDCFRSEFSQNKNIDFSALEDDEEMSAGWEIDTAVLAYNREEEQKNLVLEIQELNGEFKLFGFDWKKLEKYRIYIISLVLISKGEYSFIYSFMPEKFLMEAAK